MFFSLLFVLATIYLSRYIGIFSTVAFGGIGLFAGSLCHMASVKSHLDFYKYNKRFFLILLLICFSVLLVLHIFSITLPFHLTFTYLTFSWFLTFLSLSRLSDNNYLSNALAFAGHYTLLGYIAQMLIIRLIYIFLNKAGVGGYNYYIINVLISTALLHIFLHVISFIRNQSSIFDKAYRFVFQWWIEINSFNAIVFRHVD